MPRVDVVVESPIADGFRVRQIAGMFDLRLEKSSRLEFSAELPGADEDWQIGAIVGPSGSGKTTIARAAFGDALYCPAGWPADRAVIEGLGELPVKQITKALTAVGFSSPPAWLRPYRVLSCGEKFRCDLAKALLSPRELVVFDEFTSVVDRTVAKIGSAAVARAVRRGDGAHFLPSPSGRHSECVRGKTRRASLVAAAARRASSAAAGRGAGGEGDCASVKPFVRQFIAVTCHCDILPWLEPDWVLDMATGELSRGRLRRPRINLEVFACRREAWEMFAPHHYLNGTLNRGTRCYLATWNNQPVAFAALIRTISKQTVWRISRLVVLPDFQGIGIGGRFCEALGEIYAADKARLRITTSHPAMIGYLKNSRAWRVVAVHRAGRTWGSFGARKDFHTASAGRCVVVGEWMGV